MHMCGLIKCHYTWTLYHDGPIDVTDDSHLYPKMAEAIPGRTFLLDSDTDLPANAEYSYELLWYTDE